MRSFENPFGKGKMNVPPSTRTERGPKGRLEARKEHEKGSSHGDGTNGTEQVTENESCMENVRRENADKNFHVKSVKSTLQEALYTPLCFFFFSDPYFIHGEKTDDDEGFSCSSFFFF